MIFERFLGGSWAPKSSQNRQKWRPKRVRFAMRFRTSVFIDFRSIPDAVWILDPKMASEINAFGVRIRSRRIWAETSKFGESTTLFHVFPRSGTSKTNQKSIEKRSWIRDTFWTPFWDHFRSQIRTILGPQNGRETPQNRPKYLPEKKKNFRK